jgi:hypothetical protein
MKIEIKHRVTGAVLYSYECDGNTIKKTLERAVLSGADLSFADLSFADLSGADLSMFCKWSHSMVDNKIKIGCETRTIEDWTEFFESGEVIETPRDTDDFKRIRAVFESYKAYINVINK